MKSLKRPLALVAAVVAVVMAAAGCLGGPTLVGEWKGESSDEDYGKVRLELSESADDEVRGWMWTSDGQVKMEVYGPQADSEGRFSLRAGDPAFGYYPVEGTIEGNTMQISSPAETAFDVRLERQ